MADNEGNATTTSEHDEMSRDVDKISAALAKAQGEITGASRDSTNPHFKSKYADLESTWEAIRSPLSKNGIAVVQTVRPSTNGVLLVTMLVHSSGQWFRGFLYLPVSKNDAQGYGSAITYARRYALQAMCGVAPVDDDGNAATGRTESTGTSAWIASVASSSTPERLASLHAAALSNKSMTDDERKTVLDAIGKKKEEMAKVKK